MGSGIATLPGMLNKSMLRPRRLLIYLAVLLVGLGIWWALSTWHAEANAFEQYVQEALKQYGPILLFLLLMASGVGVAKA